MKHIVYTQGFGIRKLAFSAPTWREAKDWLDAQRGSGVNYFLGVR